MWSKRSGTVIAVALTSQEPRAGFPLTLESNARGLPKRSWALTETVKGAPGTSVPEGVLTVSWDAGATLVYAQS